MQHNNNNNNNIVAAHDNNGLDLCRADHRRREGASDSPPTEGKKGEGKMWMIFNLSKTNYLPYLINKVEVRKSLKEKFEIPHRRWKI